jgi:hypothetical protein
MKKQLKGENSDIGVFDDLEGPLKRAKLTLATD